MRSGRIGLALGLALLLGILLGHAGGGSYFIAAPEPRPVTPRADLADYERSSVELFERVAPSVVQVFAQSERAQGSAGGASGTGFIWDSDGHVVTNSHVVENGGPISVRLASGEIMRATLVGRAPNYDLAVVRLIGFGKLPGPILVGRSSDLKVGQSAFAIGNPFGLDQSLTTGVVSALKRQLPTSGGRELADVIQTDAAINPGNSGGPLLDSAGRLIGVNTAIYSPSGASAGIGFAIPVDLVNRVVPELIRTGRVPLPGIGILAVDEAVAARIGVHGVIVGAVAPRSPAEAAGLRGIDEAGAIRDVIVSANGEAVRRLADLTREVERAGVGGTVDLRIEGSRPRDVTVRVTNVGER